MPKKKTQGRQARAFDTEVLAMFQEGRFPELNGEHSLDITYLPNEYTDYYSVDQALWGNVRDLYAIHEERSNKSGPGLILAKQSGSSGNAGTERVSGFGYDIDGMAFATVLARVDAIRSEAITHTTHSHLTTRGAIKQRAFEAFCECAGIAPDLNEKTLRDYLAANGKARLTNARLLDSGRPQTTTERGKQVVVFHFEHDPDPRARAIIPTKHPIPIRGPDGIGTDGFRAIYHALGSTVFAADGYDKTCANTARLLFLPAHRAGRPFTTMHHSGPLYDWSQLWEEAERAVVVGRKKARLTARQRLSAPRADLAEIAHVLQSIPPSGNRDEWFPAICAIYHETRASEEGRMLAHDWSSGCPESYEEADLDRDSDSLSLDHKKPATMGTLIWLAKKHDPNFKPYQRPNSMQRGFELLQQMIGKKP